MNVKQKKVFDFIGKEIKSNGYPPSVREICEGTNIKSTSSVHSHLNELEKLGVIRRTSSKSRSIELISNIEEIKNLPVVGQITAGAPILADENISDYLPIPKRFAKGSDNFILRVSGDSMINAGILDNDYVIIKKTNTCSNGQITATLINNDYSTIKRFFVEEDKIKLVPENDFLDPMYFEKEEVIILGVVVGVFRSI
ncbi:MAG: transcriptional repressor LexA [Peptostreptococcaceae bacterium]